MEKFKIHIFYGIFDECTWGSPAHNIIINMYQTSVLTNLPAREYIFQKNSKILSPHTRQFFGKIAKLVNIFAFPGLVSLIQQISQ